MNNKITKTRLKSFLLYDLFKTVIATILITILLIFIFNLVGVEPSDGQRFTLLTGDDVICGEESGEVLYKTADKSSNYPFSYDVLVVSSLQINGDQPQQDLIVKRDTYDDDILIATKDLSTSYVESLGAISFDRYMTQAKDYLDKFITNGEIDEQKVKRNFNKTRLKDNRFRGEKNKLKGYSLELKRIQTLKYNYETLLNIFIQHGEIFATEYKNSGVIKDENNSFGYAIELSKLTGKSQKNIKNAYKVVDENNPNEFTATGIYLLVGNNWSSDGDLCFEPMAYILNLIVAYTDFI